MLFTENTLLKALLLGKIFSLTREIFFSLRENNFLLLTIGKRQSEKLFYFIGKSTHKGKKKGLR